MDRPPLHQPSPKYFCKINAFKKNSVLLVVMPCISEKTAFLGNISQSSSGTKTEVSYQEAELLKQPYSSEENITTIFELEE
jgi:hypothetical protein